MSGWASSLRQATEKVTTAIQNAPKNNPSGSGGGGGFSFGRAASFLQATEKMVNSLAQNTAQATRDVVSSISAQNPTAAEYLRPVTQSQVFKRSESPTAPATIIAASTPPASTSTSVTSTTHATARKPVATAAWQQRIDAIAFVDRLWRCGIERVECVIGLPATGSCTLHSWASAQLPRAAQLVRRGDAGQDLGHRSTQHNHCRRVAVGFVDAQDTRADHQSDRPRRFVLADLLAIAHFI
jgi:hypothetical protein